MCTYTKASDTIGFKAGVRRIKCWRLFAHISSLCRKVIIVVVVIVIILTINIFVIFISLINVALYGLHFRYTMCVHLMVNITTYVCVCGVNVCVRARAYMRACVRVCDVSCGVHPPGDHRFFLNVIILFLFLSVMTATFNLCSYEINDRRRSGTIHLTDIH